jgi:DNA-directed RNA polymerase specialized sigma24 family protein
VVTTLGAADEVAIDVDAARLLALDTALGQLAALDPHLARLVELRYFGGMSLEEAGAALDMSTSTIKRGWRKARAFLHDAIGADTP